MNGKIMIFCLVLTCLLLVGISPLPYAAELPTVVINATGGTIASLSDPKTGALVAAKTGEEIVKGVPQINEFAKIQVIQFCNILGPQISPQHWLGLSKLINEILDDPKVAGVVVTHGTSTIEETAYFLDLTVKE